jgi:hypothetical protein
MAKPVSVQTVAVHPRPGVTIHLPGGVHGFTSGPVPMRADHAKDLAKHVMTEDEYAAAIAAEKEKAAADLAAAEAEEKSTDAQA